ALLFHSKRCPLSAMCTGATAHATSWPTRSVTGCLRSSSGDPRASAGSCQSTLSDSDRPHAAELRDVLLVVLDHLLDVFAVEFCALQLAQAVHHRIVLRRLVVELHAFVRGQLHQSLVGVAVVLHHPLGEMLDRLVGCLALGEPAEL